MKFSFTFDDASLKALGPKISKNLVDFSNFLGDCKLRVPLLSAPMDTLTDANFAIALAKEGAVGVIHKNMSLELQCQEIEKFRKAFSVGEAFVGAAIGIGDAKLGDLSEQNSAFIKAKKLVESGADFLVLDSAHAHTQRVLEAIRVIKKFLPNITLIAGNVATAKGTLALIEAGADLVKVGIGSGSICTTRLVAGVGNPQLSAITECVKAANSKGIKIIADGGIRNDLDIIKCFVAGASFVMLGSYFAATSESLGKTLVINQKTYKYFRGMGSEAAMKKGSADRYFQNKQIRLTQEGIEAYREVEGSLKQKLDTFKEKILEFMANSGAKTINQLNQKASLTFLKEFKQLLEFKEVLILPSYSKVLPTEADTSKFIKETYFDFPLLLFSQKKDNQIVKMEKLWEKDKVFGLKTPKHFLNSSHNQKANTLYLILLKKSDFSKPLSDKINILKKAFPNLILFLEINPSQLNESLKLAIDGLVLTKSQELDFWNLKKIAFITKKANKLLVLKNDFKNSGDLAKALGIGIDFVLLPKESTYNLKPSEIEEKILQLKGGVASTLAYCGAKNLIEFPKKVTFVKQSSAGVKESAPHSVIYF